MRLSCGPSYQANPVLVNTSNPRGLWQPVRDGRSFRAAEGVNGGGAENIELSRQHQLYKSCSSMLGCNCVFLSRLARRTAFLLPEVVRYRVMFAFHRRQPSVLDGMLSR